MRIEGVLVGAVVVGGEFVDEGIGLVCDVASEFIRTIEKRQNTRFVMWGTVSIQFLSHAN